MTQKQTRNRDITRTENHLKGKFRDARNQERIRSEKLDYNHHQSPSALPIHHECRNTFQKVLPSSVNLELNITIFNQYHCSLLVLFLCIETMIYKLFLVPRTCYFAL